MLHKFEVAVPSERLICGPVADVCVVSPVLETLSKVVVADAVEEPMEKSVVLVSPLLA